MIKLFDRLDNVRTIVGHPSMEKQRQVAKETLDFFVPIAQILGLKAVESELLALAKKYPGLDQN